jgi:tRNA pseudouridine55 synthase
MGRRRKGRDVHGVLLLDKPITMTSNAALKAAQYLFEANKAGHTGSLDPLASGMLPLCFGEATKFSQFLLDADKHYYVEARLGIRTNTGDAEGVITAQRTVTGISARHIEDVLANFRGHITQIPSMYSAIKHQGKPLYHFARQGIEIERKSRPITIYELVLLDSSESHFAISVHCSKGTYIRTLVDDIGEQLGCGAHVITLQRTAVGPYRHDNMVTLDELKDRKDQDGSSHILDSYLLAVDSSLASWVEVRVSGVTALYLRQGHPVIVPRAPSVGWVKLLSHDGKFLGVGEVLADGRIAPRRLVNSSVPQEHMPVSER